MTRVPSGWLPCSPPGGSGGSAWDAADFSISDIVQGPDGSRATVTIPGAERGDASVAGARGAQSSKRDRGTGGGEGTRGPLEPALGALARYRGLGRRFERLGEGRGIAVVDDYAHHPSELVATLAAARQAFPGRRLVAVFQPHLYSRTSQHGEAMGLALAAADLVLVTGIYAAREQPIAGVSSESVVNAARSAGANVLFEADRSRVGARLQEVVREGDVVVTLGAGDITRVGRELAKWLNAA